MNDGNPREEDAKLGATEPGQFSYEHVQANYAKHFEAFKTQLKAAQVDEEFQHALMSHATRLGVEMPRLDIASLTGEVCNDWPKLKGFLNFAISLAVFWPGVAGLAGGAKALVALIDTQLVPGICKV